MLVTLSDAAYVLHPLVPFRAMCALARVQGRAQHRRRRDERAIVRRNLEGAFGTALSAAELDRLTRLAFEYRQLRGLLLALSPRLGTRRRARLFPLEGLEHLEAAGAQACGPVVVASHLNSLCNFIAMELLRERGHDIGVALPADADPQPASALRRRLDRITRSPGFRERTGAFYAQFNVRPIVRRLEKPSAVLFVGDGWHAAAFVEVDFLGRRVFFPTGPMSVARLTGSAVVTMFAVGEPPDRLRFVFDAPIFPDRELDPRADVERMVGLFAQRLERHVSANVPCWQHWFEDDALATMARLPESSLAERYQVGGVAGAARGA